MARAVSYVSSRTSRTQEQLRIENEKLKSDELCVICNTTPRNIVTLSCAHYCVCKTCVACISRCPYRGKETRGRRCNSLISGIISTYR